MSNTVKPDYQMLYEKAREGLHEARRLLGLVLHDMEDGAWTRENLRDEILDHLLMAAPEYVPPDESDGDELLTEWEEWLGA